MSVGLHCSDPEYGEFFMEQEDILYHTSSISQTAEVLQTVIDKIGQSEKHKEFSDVEVGESVSGVRTWIPGLAIEHEAPRAIGGSFPSVPSEGATLEADTVLRSERLQSDVGEAALLHTLR